MDKATMISTFNKKVADWIDNDGEDTFELDGVEFELVYDDGDYRVLCEGVEVAWNDNHKDFREVGTFLLNNK